MKVQAPAQITKVSTLSDGTIKVEAVTPELPPAEMATLFELRKSVGWLLFAANELEEQDIPEGSAEVGNKTPSQRPMIVTGKQPLPLWFRLIGLKPW